MCHFREIQDSYKNLGTEKEDCRNLYLKKELGARLVRFKMTSILGVIYFWSETF
jgi:hypothetical protein